MYIFKFRLTTRLCPAHILFKLYTDSCRMSQDSFYVAQCPDDTALLSPVKASESGHSEILPVFAKWCNLNVTKTKGTYH